MNVLVWSISLLVAGVVALYIVRAVGRVSFTRSAVLDEVRRTLRGGLVEDTPGRGPQARGRLGQLEITVDLHHDPKRPKQSPMWRVLAVGPVRVERPVEVRVGGWEGWIDTWMQLAEARVVPAASGPEFEVHAERAPTLEHPVIVALRRQGPMLGPGALHVRPDLMRAEVRFASRPEDNRELFAFLQSMVEISETGTARVHREVTPRIARTIRATSPYHVG